LGIPVESVGIICADTGATPYDRGTFSSRVTFYTGMAVKKAAVRKSCRAGWRRSVSRIS